MSHFCVYVIHNKDTSVDEILKPFDENLELEEPIIKYTKQEAIDKCKNDIEEYKNTVYARYLKNPQEYENNYSCNPQHIKYLKEEFPNKLNWTDEECYGYMKEYYDTNENEDLVTTNNPTAKWDWYEIGGRWNGVIPDNETVLENADIDNIEIPFAFITTEGVWVEKGQMGWWGLTSNEMNDEDWEKKFREYLKSLDKNLIITCVDCHI